MIVGILDAELLGKGEKREYSKLFKVMLEDKNNLTLKTYEISNNIFPNDVNECDAYLITGSAAGVYDSYPWINELRNFIKKGYEANKKMIGICFGHQLIADTLGGSAKKSNKGWGLGVQTYSIYETPTWMEPAKEEITYYFSHQDQVEYLPQNAQLLAGNDFCPIGSYTMENKILCFQGHPEFNKEKIMDRINTFNTFNSINDKSWLEEVRNKTIDSKTDSPIIAQWIINFLIQDN